MTLMLRTMVCTAWLLFSLAVHLAGWVLIANPQLGPRLSVLGIAFVIVGAAAVIVGAWVWWEEVWKSRE